ncbi:MAG: methanogenesis marker 2 protein [Candidatus Lokiarchaeota archaeon]|nr:methanogenesis marker 2 protein [Candidatus Lokiarchaeota archaeon]
MNLEKLIHSIKDFSGIRRKWSISEIIGSLKETLNYGSVDIIAAFGEDSAVFKIPEIDEHYFLIAMDGMWSKLVEANPELAGYFSILVNANDIYCKGGRPLVMVNNLGINNLNNGKRVISGIVEGCKKFKVPMIGGHLHPDDNRLSLAVSVLGMVSHNNVILSSTAEAGDKIIMAIDLDGKFNEQFVYAWDTTTHKTSKQVNTICHTMNEIAEKNLLTSAKDISNPGNIGTLGMLLETSGVGGIVNVDEIPKPRGIPLERWVKAYPGFGIVATTKNKNSDEILQIFRNKSINATICGEIITEKKLILRFERKEKLLFDFKSDKITGLKKNEDLI